MEALSRYGAEEEGWEIGTVETLVLVARRREGLDTIIEQTRQCKPYRALSEISAPRQPCVCVQ